MLHQSYVCSHDLFVNHFLQVWSIVSQIYQVPMFIYIIWYDEMSRLFRGRKVLGYIIYLMRSVKRAAEAVGIWTEDNWDVKIVNALYTMVYKRFFFKLIRVLIH